METFMMPIGGKSILRSTGKERGDRTDDDWVIYIDSNSNEHIREHLNIRLDFKPVVNDTWNKVFDFAKDNKMPTTRNCRIFEVAKELVIKGSMVNTAVSIATQLVDEVGIEIE